ncbi:50S ribosomal protein L31 [soil metagenome]
MKEKIHPKYVQARVVCACGNSFTTGSTKPELHVEVCAKCHPFFTGKQHLMDIQGRVDRFNKRYAKKADAAASAEAAPAS